MKYGVLDVPNNNSRFLIDSNTLITPYQIYYPFDLAPNFWVKLKQEINNSNLVMLDIVKSELLRCDDTLSEWIKDIDDSLILSRVSTDVISKYGEILKYIQNCGFYKTDALTNWSRPDVADAWIIASAYVNGLTVITQEKANGNLNSINKARNAKIPDICRAFNVECEDLFYMMRHLSIII